MKKFEHLHYIIYKLLAKKYRRRIKNHDFTILCNTCIGGRLYNLLGMRFDTPTINLWMSTKDFCKFCSDIQKYKDPNFVFVQEKPYPIGLLDDITIHFNHYSTIEDAVTSWRRRFARLHPDNVYIITNDDGGVTNNDLQLILNIHPRNMVVLTSKKSNLIKSFYCKSLRKQENASNFMAVVSKTKGYPKVLDDFDFIAFLSNVACE